jgi:hypothetical protein
MNSNNNKTLKNIKGNNSRRITSKYKNRGKNISNYQDKLRAILKNNKNNNIKFNINNSKKTDILENFGMTIDEINTIVQTKLKKLGRNIIHYTIFINTNVIRPCYKTSGSCLASYILNIIFYDNYGFKYTFEKRKFDKDPSINHNELSRVIFFEVSGFYNYKKQYELTNINEIDSILELPKSIIISPYILDFIKKIDRYDLLQTDINLHLTNHIESLTTHY